MLMSIKIDFVCQYLLRSQNHDAIIIRRLSLMALDP